MILNYIVFMNLMLGAVLTYIEAEIVVGGTTENITYTSSTTPADDATTVIAPDADHDDFIFTFPTTTTPSTTTPSTTHSTTLLHTVSAKPDIHANSTTPDNRTDNATPDIHIDSTVTNSTDDKTVVFTPTNTLDIPTNYTNTSGNMSSNHLNANNPTKKPPPQETSVGETLLIVLASLLVVGVVIYAGILIYDRYHSGTYRLHENYSKNV